MIADSPPIATLVSTFVYLTVSFLALAELDHVNCLQVESAELFDEESAQAHQDPTRWSQRRRDSSADSDSDTSPSHTRPKVTLICCCFK